MLQPWKYTTCFVAVAGAAWRRAQRWKVWPANLGVAALRWMPATFSTSSRPSRLDSAKLASGATGVPSLPWTSVRESIWSRSGMPFCAFITARARELISATWTPCGQARVQMPQEEQ